MHRDCTYVGFRNIDLTTCYFAGLNNKQKRVGSISGLRRHQEGSDSGHVTPTYLIELDALLRHSGGRVLETENSQLGLDQVGRILLHRGHVKHESPEVRIGLSVGDDV